ncbi:MAG: NAD(P)H-dependent oxidoreductase subunit E [Trueperaceae bacterium]
MDLPTLKPFFEDKPELLQEILDRYPPNGRRSALMPLMWEVQRAERHIGEARLHEIAEIVGVTVTEAKGVMSFYSTFHEHPVGRFHLQVCRTLSCKLAGGDELYRALVEETGLVSGETDAEGTFSLQNVECLGSCGTGPVLQVNDTYHERVTRTRLAELFAEMRAGREPVPTRERGGDNVSADKAERVDVPDGSSDDAPADAGAPADAPDGAPDGPSDEEGGVA